MSRIKIQFKLPDIKHTHDIKMNKNMIKLQ